MSVKSPRFILFKAAYKTWRHYATEASVHGMKYAVGRRMLDRWIWTFIPLLSTLGASIMMVIMYRAYFSEPTRAVYDSHFAAVKIFDFPGVTICPPKRFTNRSIEKTLNKLRYLPDVTRADAERMIPYLLGLLIPMQSLPYDLTPMDRLMAFNDLSPSDMMVMLLPKCEKFLVNCRWKGEHIPCRELFKRSKTKDGFCCSFNYRTSFRDINFASIASPFFGPSMGLSFVIDTLGEYNKQAYLLMDSFKIMIHSSQEYAGRSASEMMMPLRTELHIAIFFVMTKIGIQANKLPPELRKCYNFEEYPLQHFANYRKSDCLIECEISKNVETCGCQSYIYPKNDEDKVCNASSIPCLRQHYSQVLSSSWGNNCSCPEQCNRNATDIVTHTVSLDAVEFNPDPFYNELTENQSVVHVYAGSEYGTIVKKMVIAYWVDLISSFGGVFNLFLGCSFLSVLEVFYYILMRFPRAYFKMSKNVNKIDVKPVAENEK